MGLMEWMTDNVKKAEAKAASDVATWPDDKLRKHYEGYETGNDYVDYSDSYEKAVEAEMRNRGFIY